MQLTLGVPQEGYHVPICLDGCDGADGLPELQQRPGLQGLATSNGAGGMLITTGVRLRGVLEWQGGENQFSEEAGGTFPRPRASQRRIARQPVRRERGRLDNGAREPHGKTSSHCREQERAARRLGEQAGRFLTSSNQEVTANCHMRASS